MEYTPLEEAYFKQGYGAYKLGQPYNARATQSWQQGWKAAAEHDDTESTQ